MSRPRTQTGGLWNMLHGRNARAAARECLVIFAEHDLDWLVLGETRGYIRELHALPGVRCLSFDDKPGQADTAILVRDGIRVSGLFCARMTWEGWITVGGGRTPAKWMPTAVLGGWLRIGAVHLPPSVRFFGALPRGPVRRVAAYRRHALRLVRWTKRRRPERAVVIPGDWNATPPEPGRYGPRWIADQSGLQVRAPKDPTHGRRVIDYALARGVTVEATTHENHGSDHRLVVLRITEA